MNDDRGTHGNDATDAWRRARQEQAPGQNFGPVPPAGGGEPADGTGSTYGQAPHGPPGAGTGNGQYWPPSDTPGHRPTHPRYAADGGPAATAPAGGRDDATQPVDLGTSRQEWDTRQPRAQDQDTQRQAAPGQEPPGQEPPGQEPPGQEPPGQDAPGRASRRREAQRKRRKGRSWWVELPILLFFALVLALLIKTFVVQAFYIPSSSMENTLEIGDKVLVNKLVYDFRSIHRGDIVVFNGDGSWNIVAVRPKPALERLWDSISGLFGTAPGVHDYIKRVIGIPGDHVACCDSQGHVTINGVPIYEKGYLYPGDEPSANRFNIVVPPGRLWVMGDHRGVSWDSRGHMNYPGRGTIAENHVVGRAFVIIAPVSRWGILPIPSTFEQPKLSSAAAGAVEGISPAAAVPAASLSALGQPEGPLALGLAAAFPLTWAQRRMRRRLGPLARHGVRMGRSMAGGLRRSGRGRG
jgi:signal peptidase I